MEITASEPSSSGSKDLSLFAWISVGAALLTIVLKSAAWWATGSVGLLSDAAESSVNLVAAIATLVALRVSCRPPNQTHPFGQSKAEYFSAALEGQMIFIAAVFILYSASQRLIDPQPLEQVDIGLLLACASAGVNAVVGLLLLRVGRKQGSAALVADGKHLLSDVWTTVGVVVGLLLVHATGIDWLDPIVAIAVALHILWIGWSLLVESTSSLLDRAWEPQDREELVQMLSQYQSASTKVHGLRTRASGRERFAEMHVLVPGEWTVSQGYELVAEIEAAVRTRFSNARICCELEPLEDPRSYDDFPYEDPVPQSTAKPELGTQESQSGHSLR